MNNCFGRHFLVAASKHDENYLITFILPHFRYHILPSNFSCLILSDSNSTRKSKIGKVSFFTRKPECRNLQTGNFQGTLRYFFISVVLSYNVPLTKSLKRKTYRDMKGKLIQLLESVLSVSQRGLNKSCKDSPRQVGKKWCSNEIANQ